MGDFRLLSASNAYQGLRMMMMIMVICISGQL